MDNDASLLSSLSGAQEQNIYVADDYALEINGLRCSVSMW